MITLRTIFLFLHICTVSLWVAEGAVSLILGRFIRAYAGKPVEATLTLAMGRLESSLGSIAGMGILLTGLGLIWQDHYGLLGIGGGNTPTWLFIKQVVYIIIMGVVGSLIIPRSRKAEQQLEAAIKDAGAVTPEVRALLGRVNMFGIINTVLVLINVFLAVWKPT
jgi:hypothetical protein